MVVIGSGLGPAGMGPKYLVSIGHYVGGLHVADDRDDDVRRHVIFLVEGFGLGGGDLADLALPADAGHGRDGRRKRWPGTAPPLRRWGWSRCACGAPPAPRRAPCRTRGRPGGRCGRSPCRPTVPAGSRACSRRIGSSPPRWSVHADRAVLLGEIENWLGTTNFSAASCASSKTFLSCASLAGSWPTTLAVLGVVGGVGDLDLGQRDLLRGIVGGADLVGALEGHVLEHVGEAAGALGIVGRTGVDQRVVAEDRRLRPLADDQGEAVGQHLHGRLLFEAGEVLRVAGGSCAGAATPQPNTTISKRQTLWRPDI
jgi:hypothetical protein